NGAVNDGDYLIIVPRVFRAGTTQNIGINIFGNKSCDVRLTLDDSTKRGISSQARGHFQPNEAGMLKLQVPDGLSNVKVGATVCGVQTAKKTVTYEALAKKVFIQTDKPIYKPGQKVLIRIICVDYELKPAGKKVSSVVIQEPSGARIMQWNDVELEDGVANLDLQLSKEPVLGNWLIKAKIESKTVTKQIEIDKYVLPKFQLDVKPPSYLALDQREIFVSICARYSYGKLVTGRLEATICLKYDTVTRNCLTEIKNVTGCVEINARELVDPVTEYMPYYTNKYYLQIQATFTETSTGVKLKEYARSPNMVEKSKIMSFTNVPQKFKPGFPITFKIRINYLDGKPVTNGRLTLEVSGRRFNKKSLGTLFRRSYSVNNGLISVFFSNVPIYTETLNFKANYNSGQLEKSKSSKALYSPSLSYLRLVLPEHVTAKVGSLGSVNVLYTVHENNLEEIPFHYKILCKGNLRQSGVTKVARDNRLSSNRNERSFTYNGRTIQRRSVNKFELKFNVTQDMVPSCRILVYYVKKDKETVGDSIVFDVEEKLENQISVDFVEAQKTPGQKTKIVMKAKPGSRVAISALDKSVLFLRDSEEVKKEEVMRILNRQDIGLMNARSYSKCKSPSRMPLETDASEAFNVSTKIIFIFEDSFVSLNGILMAAWSSAIHCLQLSVDTPPAELEISYVGTSCTAKLESPNSGLSNNCMASSKIQRPICEVYVNFL
ncbi:C3 and PZP-like alpha-2-macroglobulin domain-containing 8 isoform X1, partial [Paramuricea clavata]